MTFQVERVLGNQPLQLLQDTLDSGTGNRGTPLNNPVPILIMMLTMLVLLQTGKEGIRKPLERE